jgi:hypothetical protein
MKSICSLNSSQPEIGVYLRPMFHQSIYQNKKDKLWGSKWFASSSLWWQLLISINCSNHSQFICIVWPEMPEFRQFHTQFYHTRWTDQLIWNFVFLIRQSCILFLRIVLTKFGSGTTAISWWGIQKVRFISGDGLLELWLGGIRLLFERIAYRTVRSHDRNILKRLTCWWEIWWKVEHQDMFKN